MGVKSLNMYIRQTSLFSFEEIIKFQQQSRLELILSNIDVSKLANELRKPSNSKGPKGYEPEVLIYSLIAMQVEKIDTIKDLVVKLKENPRYYGYPLRYTDAWKKQYDKRTPVERCFSRLKCYLNLDNIRSKGIKKVKVHAILNCIALISGTIAINTMKSLSKAA